MERLRGRVPVAPVRSLAQALDVDELRQRGMLAEYEHPSFGLVRSIGLPLTMGGFEPTYGRGPALDADGVAILTELGLSANEVASLRAGGAFGRARTEPGTSAMAPEGPMS